MDTTELRELIAEFNRVNRFEHICQSAGNLAPLASQEADHYWRWQRAAVVRWEALHDQIDEMCRQQRCKWKYSQEAQEYALLGQPNPPDYAPGLDYGGRLATHSEYRPGERAGNAGNVLHVSQGIDGQQLYIVENTKTGFPDVVPASEIQQP